MRIAVGRGGTSTGRGGYYHLERLHQGTIEEAAIPDCEGVTLPEN